jgi:TonB-dependent SusC/RagA subfamily outer membrane receptor
VLDGVPLPVGVGALNGVSPQDVARIDVLKDAEAAVYGSQAANGVILVRTRRGRP